MPQVNFSDYAYYPCLQSSPSEHIGYHNLTADVKNGLLPIFELNRRGKSPDLAGSIAVTAETTHGRPFILDLCQDAAPPPVLPRNPANARAAQAQYQQDLAAQQAYNNQLRQLLDPTDGFAEWRRLAGMFPTAVPVLQYTDPATQGRALLRQATALAADGSCLAIRVKLGATAGTAGLVANILAILGSPERLLIVFDCGMARRRPIDPVGSVNEFTRELMRLVDIDEAQALNIVFMSSSFTARGHEGLQELPNLDIPLWLEATDLYGYAFGDYGATIRRSNQFVPPDWRAQPVYPLDDSWLAYRHHIPNEEYGWVAGCQLIVDHERYRPTPQCWGVSLIERAAGGNIDGVNSSKYWNAAKVNIHITRMLRHIGDLANDAMGIDD